MLGLGEFCLCCGSSWVDVYGHEFRLVAVLPGLMFIGAFPASDECFSSFLEKGNLQEVTASKC